LALMIDAKLLHRPGLTIYFDAFAKCHKAIILAWYNRSVVFERVLRSEPSFRFFPQALSPPYAAASPEYR
jgi:hypothetical protein